MKRKRIIRLLQKQPIFGDKGRKGKAMAGNILRKAGVVLLTILKGLLQILLYIFKFVLMAVKMFLMLLSMVLRVFLSFFGISFRE